MSKLVQATTHPFVELFLKLSPDDPILQGLMSQVSPESVDRHQFRWQL